MITKKQKKSNQKGGVVDINFIHLWHKSVKNSVKV